MNNLEQWREEKLQEIWNLAIYSHIPEDQRIEAMLPEHKIEFMTDEERLREISMLSSQYRGKVETDSSKYDVKKVNEDIKETTKNKKSTISKKREEYLMKSIPAYGEKIKEKPKPKRKKAIVKYDDAIEVFGQLFLEKSFHDSAFVVDEYNRKAIKKLLMYFIGDPDVEDQTKVEGGTLNLNKGIYLFGDVGSGKTNLMYQLHLFLKKYRFDTRFQFNDFKQTIEICQSKGIEYLDKFKRGSWCHDELISKDINNYGNKIEPAQSIICRDYNRFINTGVLTHFTGNGTPQELGETLGVVAYSRLSHMCNFIFMGQINRRPNND
jgi:chromosomal replication initiation ATPase DnaA